MPPRFFVEPPLQADQSLVNMAPSAARHAQVLRLQPGDPVILFDGRGGQWHANVAHMGRRDVQVQLVSHEAVECELSSEVTLAVGMPANDRFDWLVEKATELGAHSLQPLVCDRSVLRVAGDRAERKRDHWQGVAVAAAEQCGRTRVPEVAVPLGLVEWLRQLPAPLATTGQQRWLLSPQAPRGLRAAVPTQPQARQLFLSGPEGGLTAAEEQLATQAGFQPVHLGPRILRAETAPLAALVVLGG